MFFNGCECMFSCVHVQISNVRTQQFFGASRLGCVDFANCAFRTSNLTYVSQVLNLFLHSCLNFVHYQILIIFLGRWRQTVELPVSSVG